MASRTRSRKRRRSGGGLDHRTKSILLFCLAAALFGILGFVNFNASKEYDRVDHATNCLVGKPESVTVVLIDHTDKVNAIQRASIEKRLWDIARSIPKSSAIEVYAVDRVNDTVLEPEISLCHPGDVDDVNELTGNKKIAQNKYEKSFKEPLSRILDRILTAEAATQSPIMEAVQSVAVTSFIGEDNMNADKNFILVSDLLEHTDSFSMYRTQVSFEDYRATEHWRSIKSDLDNVNVEIFFLRRDGANGLQNTDLRSFWIEYFQDQGAVVRRFVPIEG